MNNENTGSVGSVGSVGSFAYLGDTLEAIRTWLSRFIYVQNPRDLEILALWTFHTWICEDLYTSPRLLINSPVPGSGKTTLLEHLKALCARPQIISSVSSPALLVRLIQKEPRTLLFDEADRNLNPKRPGVDDLLAVINSGYKVGSTRPVLIAAKGNNWEAEEMGTFSPVAIAGNGTLLPEDTKQRCITIQLLPDRNGEIEESDWEKLDPEAKALAEAIAAAAELYREEIKSCSPQLPPDCKNRHRERWKPLARIAETASAEWARRVTHAITEDLETIKQLNESGDAATATHVQLVEDLHQVFTEAGELFIPTKQLIRDLQRVNPSQWTSASYFGRDLTEQRLGRLLTTNFGIYSVRPGGSPKGYRIGQFVSVWNQLGVSSNKPAEPTEQTEQTGNV